MNKRTFTKIQTLYEEGLPLESALYALISLSKDTYDAVTTIVKFFNENDIGAKTDDTQRT